MEQGPCIDFLPNDSSDPVQLQATVVQLRRRLADLDRDNAILKAFLFRHDIELIEAKEEKEERWLIKYLALQKRRKEELRVAREKFQRLRLELRHSFELLDIQRLKYAQRQEEELKLLDGLESSLVSIHESLAKSRQKCDEHGDSGKENRASTTNVQQDDTDERNATEEEPTILLAQECVKDIFNVHDGGRVVPGIGLQLSDRKYLKTYRNLIGEYYRTAKVRSDGQELRPANMVQELIKQVQERRHSLGSANFQLLPGDSLRDITPLPDSTLLRSQQKYPLLVVYSTVAPESRDMVVCMRSRGWHGSARTTTIR